MNPDPTPFTTMVNGWTFSPEDWDDLLPPLETGKIEEVDSTLRDISFSHIRNRHSPSRIRGRLAMGMGGRIQQT